MSFWEYDGKRFPRDNGIRWKRIGWRGWGLWVRDSRIAGPSEADAPGRLYWFGPYRFRVLGPGSA